MLGKIFTAGVPNDISVAVDDATTLLDPVGTSAYQVQGVKLDAAKPDLQVFDLTAKLDASATAQASILAPSVEISPFDPATPLTAPSGSSYAQLSIDGDVSGSAGGTTSRVPLTVSASGTPSFTYAHWVTAQATETRVAALTRLAATAQLPQFASLTTLLPGEATKFSATLQIDFGVQEIGRAHV